MTDFENQVMRQIRRFEKRQVLTWIILLIFFLIFGLGIAIGYLMATIQELTGLDTLELINYWWTEPGAREAFWIEFPKEDVMNALLGLAISIIVLVVFIKHFKVLKKKVIYLTKTHSKVNK